MPIMRIPWRAAMRIRGGGDGEAGLRRDGHVVQGVGLLGHQVQADAQQGDQADRQQDERGLPRVIVAGWGDDAGQSGLIGLLLRGRLIHDVFQGPEIVGF